jgi:hypothetical protein
MIFNSHGEIHNEWEEKKKVTNELNTKQKQSHMEGMVKENNQTRSLRRNGK